MSADSDKTDNPASRGRTSVRINDEHLGGDPPCWAHLFGEDCGDQSGGAVDLLAITLAATTRGPAWTTQSDDFNINLLVFAAEEGVAEHINTELDILIVGVAGEGLVTVNGEPHVLRAGHLIIAPKGSVRSTRAISERFAYLSCRRRRPGLTPTLSTSSP